ncbi:MAG: LLM class flavin-dependent oxidoreductase [Proteobacteria bacterium]|nr:LLM class flavin-dependent oxidoreductase [Pseudomonadota bacterium]
MTIAISVELSHVCPLDEIGRQAEALEQNGFYRVWVPDTSASPWEVWLAAGRVAQRTRRIRIGLGVTNPFTRHPFVLAQAAASLQGLCGGRLALSIGKGIPRFFEKAGIETYPSGVEECITIVRDLIAGERVSHDGPAFRIDGLRLRTIPPETPVPIYLAAVSPESWRSALRVADGVATFWSEEAAANREQAMTERTLPTAALAAFSLSEEAFFPGTLQTLDALRERIDQMDRAGFDEVIVAYRDLSDLEAAGTLV